jgi:hypothetical protein
MGELPFTGQEPLTLTINDDAARLTFELDPKGEDLLASLACPLAPYDRTTMTRALSACSLETSPDWPLRVGLHGDKLLLMAKVEKVDWNAPALETLILRLAKVHESVLSD